MDFNWILIRYGEIGLKSSYVRRSFENRLMENIRRGLENKGIDGKVQRGYGRIFLNTTETNKASELLKKIFGVVSFSPCVKIEAEFEGIVEKLVELGEEKISEEDSFAVRVRRTGEHGFSSKDIEEEAGRIILEKTNSEVNLDRPDFKIMADVRQGQCYIFGEKTPGPGGLPLGTQGKVVSLITGDCGSFLSTWMMMKRGCSVVVLHGKMDPYGDIEIDRTIEELGRWSHGSSVDVIDFDHGMNLFNIKEEGERGYTCILCKRLLLRVAERVAEKVDASAIVTGEWMEDNLGEMKFTDSSVEIPVVRPLIGMNRNEVREMCRNIPGDTFPMTKVCEAMETGKFKVEKERLEEIESRLNIDELVEDALEAR